MLRVCSRINRQSFQAQLSGRFFRPLATLGVLAAWWAATAPALATPMNKAALGRYLDSFLQANVNQCATCHQPVKLEHPPQNLDEFPHNAFGRRLRLLGEELKKDERKADLETRLELAAHEDTDGDGVENQTELLLGYGPGDAGNTPSPADLKGAPELLEKFAALRASYRWRPFEPVSRPPVPQVTNLTWVRNPIDAFVAAKHEAKQLQPRPPALKAVLLRRVYLDLIGLAPTPDELRVFEAEDTAGAYERVVNRLLADPRYGERWGRHWMDIWRYSDWAGWSGGNQIRDSKPHIWRWRDWIVESLNADKGYDRMIVEMLAADELSPEDTDALRATGYLVRNYKMLSREQWMEDTIKHTSQAFLGLTVGCAKCHDHMFDPISQLSYYQMRAVFEPHNVRTDQIPGQLDTAKDGLVRVYDATPDVPTRLYNRGDERQPDTNRVIAPAVPVALGGEFQVTPVSLPRLAYHPERREFVIREETARSERNITAANEQLESAPGKGEAVALAESSLALARARHDSLLATLRAEELEEQRETGAWKEAATRAATLQRELAVAEARHNFMAAQQAEQVAKAKVEETSRVLPAQSGTDPKTEGERKKSAEKAAKVLTAASGKTSAAEKAVGKAMKERDGAATTAYKPRSPETNPARSTGRRLALARWIGNASNPLTARVAVNHLWLRHFGEALVPSVADFGANGRRPTHPELVDWLAAELMAQNWSMKELHRLMVTSSTYRMASTPDPENARRDQDNVWLWRMHSRRMEAEVVRDNVLYLAGQLDLSMGGPEVDHMKGLESRRRSIYLRIAAEKEVEFLRIFDGPSVNECYRRDQTVMPQQALALGNSSLTLGCAHQLVTRLSPVKSRLSEEEFAREAFLRVLARSGTAEEVRLAVEFLQEEAGSSDGEAALRARENLLRVLLNHHDFVTIR